MARPRTRFVCQACGYSSPRWLGRCTECEAWDSFVEEAAPAPRPGGRLGAAGGGASVAAAAPLPLAAVGEEAATRFGSGMPLLDRVYDSWSFNAIPKFGKAITGEAEPYQYLVESIRKFPNQENFAEMIRNAGFSRVSFTNYTGGIAALHSGWKL